MSTGDGRSDLLDAVGGGQRARGAGRQQRPARRAALRHELEADVERLGRRRLALELVGPRRGASPVVRRDVPY